MIRLREALDAVPDHRSSQGRRHSLGAILSLSVCAMLCGARSLYAIAQWGRDHGVATGQLLGFQPGKTPCVATLHPKRWKTQKTPETDSNGEEIAVGGPDSFPGRSGNSYTGH